MVRSITTLFLLMTAFVIANEDDTQLVTLTANDGRTIDAEILAVHEASVEVRRSDGYRFEIPMTALDEETRKMLQHLATELALAQPGAWEIEFDREKGDRNTIRGEAITEQVRQEHYEITVVNQTGLTLSNVDVHWHLFVENEEFERGTRERDFGKQGTVRFEEFLPGEPKTFATESVELVKSSLNPGWVWASGNLDRRRNDRLRGVVVEIEVGGTIVHRSSRPESLAEDLEKETQQRED